MPRDVAPRAASTPRRFDRLSRLPWLPLLIVALLVLSALFAVDPIRNAATGGPIGEATLRRSGGYLLLGPISAVLDTITLLSLRQHVALVVTLECYQGEDWGQGVQGSEKARQSAQEVLERLQAAARELALESRPGIYEP